MTAWGGFFWRGMGNDDRIVWQLDAELHPLRFTKDYRPQIRDRMIQLIMAYIRIRVLHA